MLNIGNKKYRNLQEQVAYNTECIKKLDDYLDGITIEDKLVVIESDSGTFTDEELVILSAPLAFISNGNRVWMKDSETLVEFVYKAIDIKATEVGSAYFNIGGSKIVVNRETGAYNTSSDTIITTYSKSQIDSIVNNIMASINDKASLSGATFTGAVLAPTFSQSQANYSIPFSFPSNASFEITNVYNRFEVINKSLHVICNIKLKNISGVTQTLGAEWGSILYLIVNLDHSIAQKIIDFDGISAGEVGTDRKIISGVPCIVLKGTVDSGSLGTYKTVRFDLTNWSGADQVAVYIQSDTVITMNPNDEIIIMARKASTIM